MKKLFVLIALATLLMAAPAFAATNVTLRWDANSEPDLAGYRIYRSTIQGSGYVKVGQDVIAPTTEFVDMNVPDGTYYWVATAFDTDNLESGYSNEVSDTLESLPPAPPQNLTIWQKIIAWLKSFFNFGLRIV